MVVLPNSAQQGSFFPLELLSHLLYRVALNLVPGPVRLLVRRATVEGNLATSTTLEIGHSETTWIVAF
jgi:hypothetical protein